VTPEPPLSKLASPLPAEVPDWPRVDVSAPVRAAAKVAAVVGVSGVILTRVGTDIGSVLASELLALLAQDLDTVSGLPRSGPLRDWLGEQLADGREVSVVFLDLDSFGEINIAHGHSEGDAALARVAGVLQRCADERDFVARFGGDEFAIGCLRKRDAALDLAESIRGELEAARLPASIGISGGRREGVRDDANLGSVVEELLRLASVDCLDQKPNRG